MHFNLAKLAKRCLGMKTTGTSEKVLAVQDWTFEKCREMIHHYCVCIRCRKDKTNFCFPQQILVETIPKLP